MTDILLECLLFINLGYGLRRLRPLGFDAETTRKSIVSLVFVLLLPALVLKSLWSSPAELIRWEIAFSVASGLLLTALLVWLVYRRWTSNTATLGALILAGSLSNATYQGLPIVTDQLGALGTAIAIQYDFFAQTPILLSLGIILASWLGHTPEGQKEHWTLALVKVPALWAAALGLILNQMQFAPVEPFMTWLTHLSQPVIPLMLLTIGLGLRLESLRLKNLPFLAPVLIIKLLILPAIVVLIATSLGLEEQILLGLALEAGMSSIVIAIVVCERYHLDTGKYIEVVTLTLLLSLGTLPLWKWLIG